MPAKVTEIVRVLRLVEYVGPREWVEAVVSGSVKGRKDIGPMCYINAVTLTEYPEVLERTPSDG